MNDKMICAVCGKETEKHEYSIKIPATTCLSCYDKNELCKSLKKKEKQSKKNTTKPLPKSLVKIKTTTKKTKMKPELEHTEETEMKAEEYNKIRKEIFRKYPTGIDHMAIGDTDSLFEELSGRITVPAHFSSEHVIHLLNIQATKKHLVKYTAKLQILYNIAKGLKKKPRSQANKAYKKRLNIRIDTLARLINESRDNIKMSMYGINEQLLKKSKTSNECGYSQHQIFGYSQHRKNISI